MAFGILLCIIGFFMSMGLTQYFPDTCSIPGRIALAVSAALFITAAASRD
jgi:hypothetical protein